MATLTPPSSLPTNLTATHTHTEFERGGYAVEWDDFAVTLTLRGRVYPVAELTQFPDGETLVTRSASIRTAAQHGAWANLVYALGGRGDDPRRYQFCTRERAQ